MTLQLQQARERSHGRAANAAQVNVARRLRHCITTWLLSGAASLCFLKQVLKIRSVSGHDFSRAEETAEDERALAPAEKDLGSSERPQKRTSGAKARIDFAAFAARLKSCPDTKPEFFIKFPGVPGFCFFMASLPVAAS
jgi:hypothetical protein